jgi:hypothetical protein
MHLRDILTTLLLTTPLITTLSYAQEPTPPHSTTIKIQGLALNPEGIEYHHHDRSLFLSSLNALPITKVDLHGNHTPFSHGEPFPLSTAGLQIDQKHQRLLAASFNGNALLDNNASTKGVSYLRIYDLKKGALTHDVPLSHLLPNANAYFANDIAVDEKGNSYISDWYGNAIYRVDLQGNATLFWSNHLSIQGGPNGLDYHPDGYLLVSLLNVNPKGLYSNYGLIKIPLQDPSNTTVVDLKGTQFSGFDGMVLTPNGTILGISNDQKSAGGNLLLELSSNDQWQSATQIATTPISPSTTLALSPTLEKFILHQDFSNSTATTWRVEKMAP